MLFAKVGIIVFYVRPKFKKVVSKFDVLLKQRQYR